MHIAYVLSVKDWVYCNKRRCENRPSIYIFVNENTRQMFSLYFYSFVCLSVCLFSFFLSTTSSNRTVCLLCIWHSRSCDWWHACTKLMQVRSKPCM